MKDTKYLQLSADETVARINDLITALTVQRARIVTSPTNSNVDIGIVMAGTAAVLESNNHLVQRQAAYHA